MKCFVLLVLFVLFAACVCGPLPASGETPQNSGMIYFQMEGGRFYNCAPLDTPYANRLVAVGQKSPGQKGSKRRGYVAVLIEKNNELTIAAEDMFSVEHKGKKWPTRVRTVAVVNRPGGKNTDIYITGRSGSDEEGIGFLRHYRWENNMLSPTRTVVMSQKQEGIVYTHGYSLKTGDIDGDGQQEAVYGGFFGRAINQHLSEDFSDVRVFSKTPGGSIEESAIKPFEKLKIPLRVNALEVKDLDGDGKAEIIIAGRSRQGDHEYSAFAIWSGGRISYHIDREQSLPGRFRTVMAADIDGDGKNELITGGRIDMDKRMVADLQIWELTADSVSMTARYNWTSEASTRLRALAPAPGNSHFVAAGRTELLHSGDSPRWIGFIRRFQLKDNSLWPVDLPFLLDKGPETRIRDIKFLGNNRYLCSGFIMKDKKKSAGFVLIRFFANEETRM